MIVSFHGVHIMKIETKQDAFDFAVRHMHKQREKSVEEGHPKCLYRSTAGKKCIVGAMIDDKYYNPNFEYTALSDNSIKEALQNSGVSIEENECDWAYFFRELQQVHDRWQGWDMSELKKAFVSLASRTCLDTNVFDELKW